MGLLQPWNSLKSGPNAWLDCVGSVLTGGWLLIRITAPAQYFRLVEVSCNDEGNPTHADILPRARTRGLQTLVSCVIIDTGNRDDISKAWFATLLESGVGEAGKDGPLLAYAPWAYIYSSQGGSDAYASVNPSGRGNPRLSYAPLPTVPERTPSLTARGYALVPGAPKIPRARTKSMLAVAVDHRLLIFPGSTARNGI